MDDHHGAVDCFGKEREQVVDHRDTRDGTEFLAGSRPAGTETGSWNDQETRRHLSGRRPWPILTRSDGACRHPQ
jgi:hypothetical protein